MDNMTILCGIMPDTNDDDDVIVECNGEVAKAGELLWQTSMELVKVLTGESVTISKSSLVKLGIHKMGFFVVGGSTDSIAAGNKMPALSFVCVSNVTDAPFDILKQIESFVGRQGRKLPAAVAAELRTALLGVSGHRPS